MSTRIKRPKKVSGWRFCDSAKTKKKTEQNEEILK